MLPKPNLKTVLQHPKRIPKQRILSLFDLHFIEQKYNVLFIGQPGLGKTQPTNYP
jgi:DNA replication protein DnaC